MSIWGMGVSEEMMPVRVKIYLSNKKLWFSWILVTSIGSMIGFALIGMFADSFDNNYVPVLGLLLITISGLFFSFGQWLILRTRWKTAWVWIPATIIGLPLGFFIGFWVDEYMTLDLQPFTMSAVAGMITGAIQFLAMHRKLKGLIWWSLVSAISWGIGVTIVVIIGPYLLDLQYAFKYYSFLGFLIGAGMATISGAFVEYNLVSIEHNKKLTE